MLYPVSSAALAPAVATAGASALRRVAHPLAAIIGITAVSGKLIADLDAYALHPKCLHLWQADTPTACLLQM